MAPKTKCVIKGKKNNSKVNNREFTLQVIRVKEIRTDPKHLKYGSLKHGKEYLYQKESFNNVCIVPFIIIRGKSSPNI